MNNLFNEADVKALLGRIDKVTAQSVPQWGKMNSAQMMAHCHVLIEVARGQVVVPQVFIGKLIGGLAKKGALGPKPFSKNSPTDKHFLFPTDVDFAEKKSKLQSSLQLFHDGGPDGCTKHPHPFFGKMTPDEWATLQWKHLDHHLRQFGA